MHLETLEARFLFASPTAAIAKDGTLTIDGTPARDRIRVYIMLDLSGGEWKVQLNGRDAHLRPPTTPDWPYWSPSRIVIRGGGGDDLIKLNSPLGGVPTTINGGDGNDQIFVYGRYARIFGGRGNDHITLGGNVSSDERDGAIFGGDGDDLITGSSSSNVIHGGAGNDTLIGGKGDDQLFGDAGNDALEGGDGIDTFFGGDGNDRIYSGDAVAHEPVDGGSGHNRVLFPNDCGLPMDNFVSIDRILMQGTHHLLFCMI
jgi:Ca2+-binding RTX toxin-like protein